MTEGEREKNQGDRENEIAQQQKYREKLFELQNDRRCMLAGRC